MPRANGEASREVVRARDSAHRSVARRLARAAAPAAASIGELSARASSPPLGLVLLYHEVSEQVRAPDDEVVPSVPVAGFEAQLRRLRSRYDVVPPSQLLAAARVRRRGERYPVAITFDDDARSHVELAAPVLERLRLPAAFFLTGASLRAPYAFWWERLQRAYDEGRDDLLALPMLAGTRPHGTRRPPRELARAVQALTPPERDSVAAWLGDGLGPDPEGTGLRASDVRALASAGFEIGFHTVRHDPLPSLDHEALARALVEGRAELAAAAGRSVTMIAYPHGLGDVRVACAARESGYALGFEGGGRPVSAGVDPLRIPRIGTEASPSLQALRLARSVIAALRGRA